MSTFSPDTGEEKVCFNAKMLHTFIKKRGQIFFIYITYWRLKRRKTTTQHESTAYQSGHIAHVTHLLNLQVLRFWKNTINYTFVICTDQTSEL